MLNISDLMTVFYSTRYVEGRKGRVQKLQGKATLMTHPGPKDAVERIGANTLGSSGPQTNDRSREFERYQRYFNWMRRGRGST